MTVFYGCHLRSQCRCGDQDSSRPTASKWTWQIVGGRATAIMSDKPVNYESTGSEKYIMIDFDDLLLVLENQLVQDVTVGIVLAAGKNLKKFKQRALSQHQ